MQESTFKKAFEVLQDRDAFFENVSNQGYRTSVIWAQLLLIAIFLTLRTGVQINRCALADSSRVVNITKVRKATQWQFYKLKI